MPGQTSATFATLLVLALAVATPAAAQMSSTYMVPAVAHDEGLNGTFWMSDVSLHNPHLHELPVIVQLLPSDADNQLVPTLDVTLYPWETVNLWDAMGAELFATDGTAAMLVSVAPGAIDCSPPEICELLVTSRTYTLEPEGGDGEFGQTVPGIAAGAAVDWGSFGYAAGILNDGVFFRCNIGVASWTDAWTTVLVDVQDAAGEILATEELEVPPFGHTQRRLATEVSGGSLVFYLDQGPDEALVFPYASVVNQDTGDPSFVGAVASVVGVSVDKDASADRPLPPLPGALGEPLTLPDELRGRARRRGPRW